MDKPRHFRDLIVWRKAMDLAKVVYEATAKFPSEERFGLVSQMHRCAVSVPSNIAEGQCRSSTGEFKQHLGISRGSLAELDTQTQLAAELGILDETLHMRMAPAIQEVGRMLNGLIASLATDH